jgi:hypothetical protein
MIKYLGGRKRYTVAFKEILQIIDSGFEVKDITSWVFSPYSYSLEWGLEKAYLLGISLLVIGSYPTHLTLAFSQDAQLGSL